MDGECSHCKGRLVYCFREGENVCSTCGWSSPDLVYSAVPQVSAGISNSEKIHYVRKLPKGPNDSRVFGNSERSSNNYHRPYYWHERFGQWRNRCPLIPQAHLLRIADPLYNRSSDDRLVHFYDNFDERLLSRDDIALLCRSANLKCHAEKWIQIKWRLINYPIHAHLLLILAGAEIPIQRLSEDPAHKWRWKPDFLSDEAHEKLKVFAEDVQSVFLRAQDRANEFPFMAPYKRKSFINFDFVMKRGLYMVCPHCKWDEHGINDKCWVVRFRWALKDLQTTHNIRNHVAWFYFLVRENAKATRYEKSITTTKWAICPSDKLIVNEKFKPKCPELLELQDQEPLNPDLVPRLLRRLDTYSRPPLGVGVQMPLDDPRRFSGSLYRKDSCSRASPSCSTCS